MCTKDDILNFAYAQKVFNLIKLMVIFKSEDQMGFSGTLNEQMKRLLKSGQLVCISLCSFRPLRYRVVAGFGH